MQKNGTMESTLFDFDKLSSIMDDTDDVESSVPTQPTPSTHTPQRIGPKSGCIQNDVPSSEWMSLSPLHCWPSADGARFLTFSAALDDVLPCTGGVCCFKDLGFYSPRVQWGLLPAGTAPLDCNSTVYLTVKNDSYHAANEIETLPTTDGLAMCSEHYEQFKHVITKMGVTPRVSPHIPLTNELSTVGFIGTNNSSLSNSISVVLCNNVDQPDVVKELEVLTDFADPLLTTLHGVGTILTKGQFSVVSLDEYSTPLLAKALTHVNEVSRILYLRLLDHIGVNSQVLEYLGSVIPMLQYYKFSANGIPDEPGPLEDVDAKNRMLLGVEEELLDYDHTTLQLPGAITNVLGSTVDTEVDAVEPNDVAMALEASGEESENEKDVDSGEILIKSSSKLAVWDDADGQDALEATMNVPETTGISWPPLPQREHISQTPSVSDSESTHGHIKQCSHTTACGQCGADVSKLVPAINPQLLLQAQSPENQLFLMRYSQAVYCRLQLEKVTSQSWTLTHIDMPLDVTGLKYFRGCFVDDVERVVYCDVPHTDDLVLKNLACIYTSVLYGISYSIVAN